MQATTNFLDAIGSDLSAELARMATTVTYDDGQIIHSRGSIKPGLSVVKSGSANVGMFGFEGKFIGVGLLGVGECFGEFTLFANLPRTHDILAIGKTQLYQLSSNQFKRLSDRHPEVIKALLKITLLRNHSLLEMLDAVRRLPLLERTASALMSMLMTTHSKSHIKCTQDELAFNLGVSRVSIGKALRELEQQHLITRGYGKILFPNLANFESWVDLHCNLAPLTRL